MSDLPVAHAFPCSTANGTVIGGCLPLRCCFFFGFTLSTSAGSTQALAVDALLIHQNQLSSAFWTARPISCYRWRRPEIWCTRHPVPMHQIRL